MIIIRGRREAFPDDVFIYFHTCFYIASPSSLLICVCRRDFVTLQRMARLMAIDYGRRRCGIAVTDPLRIVATGLTTVRTCDLTKWVAGYVGQEQVDAVIVGKPTTMRGEDSESMNYIRPGIAALRKALPPEIEIIFWDERFTSVLAHRSMIDGGMRKSRRQDKAVVDEIAATIILNDYLQSKQFNNK